MIRSITRTGAALLLALPVALGAQGGMDGMSHPARKSFDVGGTTDWTLGVPHIDLNGGLLSIAKKGTMAEVSEAFVSLRWQTGLGTDKVQLAGNVLFVPEWGTASQSSVLLQWVPTRNDSRFYFSAGAGAVVGRMDGGTRGEPWAQGVLGVRTPIHDLAPFIQVGMPLVDGGRTELLFGVSHPLAPYRFHLP
jgi:hypothetical protein